MTEEGPKVVTLPPGVGGDQMSPAEALAHRWAARKAAERESAAEGVPVARGVKGSGMSVEERKARARERARESYRKRRGQAPPPTGATAAPRRGRRPGSKSARAMESAPERGVTLIVGRSRVTLSTSGSAVVIRVEEDGRGQG